MHLLQAQKIAYNIVDLLMPHCTIINIAGSIRREKPEVKDIEIVCLPKLQQSTDLFGSVEAGAPTNDFVHTVASLAKQVVKGKPDGKLMQIELHQGIMLDLFMPDPYDYYRQLAIRTGSADYAAKVIAGGWRNIGWCGSDKGLRKISDCTSIKDDEGKHKSWKCINDKAQHPPAWKSEQEFFDWIKVKWISPKNREINYSLYNAAL